jgi:hypothetical protein
MDNEIREGLEAELDRLRKLLAERTGSIPIHSVRPHQLIEIEELEERIEKIEARLARL